MKVTLRSSGGITPPLLHPPFVDASKLSKSDADELAELIKAAETTRPERQSGPDLSRDAMTYTINVEADDGQRVLKASDTNLTPAFDKLMNWIRTHAGKA